MPVPKPAKATPAGAAAFTVITGQFLGSATDHPFCSPQLAITEQRDGLQADQAPLSQPHPVQIRHTS